MHRVRREYFVCVYLIKGIRFPSYIYKVCKYLINVFLCVDCRYCKAASFIRFISLGILFINYQIISVNGCNINSYI
ncbi:hypothetical protein KsCSTR_26640 [Candidatus Kuenenia stuttgartiensis]|uniref:Uncharacterized protein n=1 Tax=Kuenenia stuttgartiensis TaxID=174633 RepID=Q1Q7B6_KUEST|nr:hypothetical protein KsCSTR_26640 [Candidatus Kuenenia stuttgartiensis]CAJ73466.1 unknown protein [Candidatus Kuenenia stuttgartiensis]